MLMRKKLGHGEPMRQCAKGLITGFMGLMRGLDF
jgi:hypothetical protein